MLKGIKIIGALLTVLSLCFLGYKLSIYKEQIVHLLHLERIAFSLFFGALSYCLACFVQACAWYHFIHALDGSAPLVGSLSIYGRTLIMKYIPGNVFHFAGRQVLGSSIGI